MLYKLYTHIQCGSKRLLISLDNICAIQEDYYDIQAAFFQLNFNI